MFSARAKEAVELYVSIFKDAKITSSMDFPGGGWNGTFSLNGREFMAMDGGEHFQFSEGISLFVSCEDQAEVDDYWTKLLAGGGSESQCGWLKDQFGVSWQIIPKQLGELMGDPDPAKSARVMQAMLKMKKIIVADLQAAYDQK